MGSGSLQPIYRSKPILQMGRSGLEMERGWPHTGKPHLSEGLHLFPWDRKEILAVTGQLGLHPSSQQIWVCGFFASKHRGYTWSPTVCRDLTYICLSFLDREESDTIVILILKITRG